MVDLIETMPEISRQAELVVREVDGFEYSGIPVQADSTVYGLFGDRGEGKSCAMAYMGLRAAAAGRKVLYTPADFDFKYGEAVDLVDLIQMADKLSGATILMDEMQVLLSKWRVATAVSWSLRTFFQQIRKRGCNVYFTTNSPSELDSTLQDQTDYHGYCHRFVDPRCSKSPLREHLTDCKDTIMVSFTDTQGTHGLVADPLSGNKRRKRGRWYVHPALPIYTTYNTFAIADVADMMAITRDKIVQDSAERRSMMTLEQIKDLMREQIIPSIVEKGFNAIRPTELAKQIAADFTVDGKPLVLTPEILGHAFTKLGLERDRRTLGSYWILPEKEELEAWKLGMARIEVSEG